MQTATLGNRSSVLSQFNRGIFLDLVPCLDDVVLDLNRKSQSMDQCYLASPFWKMKTNSYESWVVALAAACMRCLCFTLWDLARKKLNFKVLV